MNTTEFKYEIKLTNKHGTETALYDSLEEIIYSVIENYCGDDLTGYELNIEDGQFNVSMSSNSQMPMNTFASSHHQQLLIC